MSSAGTAGTLNPAAGATGDPAAAVAAARHAAPAERLSVVEKVGYGLGDAAAGFVFQTMVIFQLAFYTDTFGITAAAAGTLFLVVRFFDAVFDPLMGVVADRTETRWGKFRPWVLWTAVPYGIMAVLTFTTPGFGGAGKLAYAYVTYILLMMVYSANNLPYSALSGVMTGDMAERTSLSQYRFVLAMLSQFVIQTAALPMVHALGGGDNARGYQLTMAVFGVLAVAFFVVTFVTTRERVRPDPGQHSSIAQDFGDLTRNRPWLVMFMLTLVLFVTLALRGGTGLYYFKYVVKREDLFGYFNGLGTAATIVGVALSRPLAVRLGKRNLFMYGLYATAACTAVFFVLPATAVYPIIGAEMLRQFAYGFTIPLLWAMMGDVADYSEWKNHRRATGVVFSAIVFALKAGLGVGGAIGGYVLTAYGYVPNVAQGARALEGITLSMSLFPALGFLVSGLCLLGYAIDRDVEFRMSGELAARREARASQAPREQFTHTPVPVVP